MDWKNGQRVRTPEGILTTVIESLVKEVITVTGEGEQAVRTATPMLFVRVRLDGEAIGDYPPEALEALPEEDK